MYKLKGEWLTNTGAHRIRAEVAGMTLDEYQALQLGDLVECLTIAGLGEQTHLHVGEHYPIMAWETDSTHKCAMLHVIDGGGAYFAARFKVVRSHAPTLLEDVLQAISV